MDSATLLALADRCEKAGEADRLLDAKIAIAIDLQAYEGYGARDAAKHGGAAWLADKGECHQNIWREALPRYTASLDAALTLVPDNHGHVIWSPIGKPPSAAIETPLGWSDYSKAATPALALCAAALRACSDTSHG